MLYRETGVYPDQLRQGSGDLSRPARPLRDRDLAARRVRGRAGDRLELRADRPPDAVPDHVDRSTRPERADRLLRPAQPRHRRVHGARRLHDLQAGDRLSRRAGALLGAITGIDMALPDPALGAFRPVRPLVPRDPDHGGSDHRAGRAGVRPAEPQDQGPLPRGDHARGAVLPDLAVHQGALVHQLFARRDRAGAAPHAARLPGHRRRLAGGLPLPVRADPDRA